MIPQGFPLYAVESDGTAYAVVGWDECGYPELLPLGVQAPGVLSRRDESGYVFTTTDPRETYGPDGPARINGMGPHEVASELERADSLRERLRALADDLSDASESHVAQRIRQELAR